MAKKHEITPHHWKEAVLVHVIVGVAHMVTSGNWILVELLILITMLGHRLQNSN